MAKKEQVKTVSARSPRERRKSERPGDAGMYASGPNKPQAGQPSRRWRVRPNRAGASRATIPSRMRALLGSR